jgi:chromosome segregation ATPase
LETTNAADADILAVLTRELGGLRDQVADLSTKAGAETASVTKSVVDVVSKVEELSARTEGLGTEGAAARDELRRAQARLEEIERQGSDAQARIVGLTGRFEAIEQALKESPDRAQQDALAQSLRTLAADVETLAGTLGHDREGAASLSRRVDDIAGRLDGVSRQGEEVDTIRLQISDILTRFDSLESVLHSGGTLGKLGESLVRAREQLDGLDTRIGGVDAASSNRIERIDAKLGSVDAEVRSRAAEIAELVTGLTAARQSIEALAKRTDGAEGMNHAYPVKADTHYI